MKSGQETSSFARNSQTKTGGGKIFVRENFENKFL